MTRWPRLPALPRESRDTFFLLAAIGWIVLMQSPHLPLWSTLLALALLLWRGWLTWRQQPLPPGWLRVLLLMACVAATAAQFKSIVGKDAGSTLIVLLLALKTTELKARRDAFVIFFLGFFTLLSHFFHSQSLLTAAGILLGVLALLTALVNAQLQAGYPPLRQSAGIALRMAALGTPLMLALFVLFPRFAPLWGLPASDTGKTGLSNDMTVGAIAQLAQDDSVAFRVRFDGAAPPLATLYFRGPVLGRLDGQKWSGQENPADFGIGFAASKLPALQPLQADATTALRYEITLQPHQKHWLLLPDLPIEPPTMPPGWRARQMGTLEWVAQRPVIDVLRYRGASALQYRTSLQASPATSKVDILLPPGSNPRTQELARQMLADPRYATADAPVLVQAVLERLRSGGYTYTLEPGLAGLHPADTFWFDSKQGFCEHIANAFVVLMRGLGVPARIVTGYQGGSTNPVDGLWTVRQSDAHAWAEVWYAGQGWVRIDPTAAVSANRIESITRLQPAPGLIGSAVQRISPALLARIGLSLRNVWDATNSRWNNWVLNYTQDRQFDLFRKLGFSQVDWVTLVQLLVGVLVLLAAIGAGWALWEKRQHDPWLRLLQRADARLRRSGLPLPANAATSTPRQLLAALHQHATPAHASQQATWHAPWSQWLQALEAQRYAPAAARATSDAAALATLQKQFRRLPAVPPTAPSRRK